MELTAKPCRKLPTEGSIVTPKTEKETIASPPVPTKGLVAENPGEKSVEERLLDEEYHMLEEEAQYLEQLAILKSLEDEEQRLLEVEKAQLLLDEVYGKFNLPGIKSYGSFSCRYLDLLRLFEPYLSLKKLYVKSTTETSSLGSPGCYAEPVVRCEHRCSGHVAV